ncbi:type I polyketide synthase [Nocardia takedensis]
MSRDRSFDIAVTGVAARFPGVSDLEEWWNALVAGRVLLRRYESAELAAVGVPRRLIEHPDYVAVHGHLEDADRFDHHLFRLPPREAEMLDPQHRLMLETTWAALEDAGRRPGESTPRTGVYATASPSGYMRTMLTNRALDELSLEDALHGTAPDFVAGLIAYRLGLHGPALAVHTACSSSLVALHLAVQALHAGDCDQAVVIGAGIPYPQAGRLHVEGGIHSPSGRCRPFDASADGVVAGSGVVGVVLRRFEDVAHEGPRPYGVVLGSAINNDATAKAGFYAPSAQAQEAVIRAALHVADVDANSLGYLEAHATGTRVGDPIEWSAASAALGGERPGRIAVGALKANTGHLDNAAGLAALVKALLVVDRGVIPPVADFERLNPLLDSTTSPLYVPGSATPWHGPQPRRAGVSAFGIGGTNAHVIIEQAPPSPPRPRSKTAGRLVVLSAADPDALRRSASRLGAHLDDHTPDLADVAFTLATGRAVLSERLAVVGRTPVEIATRLTSAGGSVHGSASATERSPILLLFPGQGAQYRGMALPLARALPGFTDALERCLGAFGPTRAGDLHGAMTAENATGGIELSHTVHAQAAMFAFGYAAATALGDLGVRAKALIGHSLGEITAATVAGVLDLGAAARLVTARGKAMQDCPDGAMLVLGCEEREAVRLVAESGTVLEVAAVNGPGATVLAGPPAAVLSFRAWLGDRVWSRPLHTDRAFHTAAMRPALDALAAELAEIPFRPTRIPLITNLEGRVVRAGGHLDKDYFVRQARRTVRFADGLAAAEKHFPDAVVVEIGPRRGLSAQVEAAGLRTVALSPGLGERPEEEVLLALGTLWASGLPVDIGRLGGDGARIHLPGYAFHGRRWAAPEAALSAHERPAARDTPETTLLTTEPSTSAANEEPAGGRLATLWSELLGQPDLSEESDFFELGGDSLLITRLVRKVNEEFAIRTPVRTMLSRRTLGQQTALINELLTARS